MSDSALLKFVSLTSMLISRPLISCKDVRGIGGLDVGRGCAIGCDLISPEWKLTWDAVKQTDLTIC